MTELEKQEKEVQRMREQQEFSLLRVRPCYYCKFAGTVMEKVYKIKLMTSVN